MIAFAEIIKWTFCAIWEVKKLEWNFVDKSQNWQELNLLRRKEFGLSFLFTTKADLQTNLFCDLMEDFIMDLSIKAAEK